MDNWKMQIVPQRRDRSEWLPHGQEAPFKKRFKGHGQRGLIRIVNVEFECAHRICRPHPSHYARTSECRQGRAVTVPVCGDLNEAAVIYVANRLRRQMREHHFPGVRRAGEHPGSYARVHPPCRRAELHCVCEQRMPGNPRANIGRVLDLAASASCRAQREQQNACGLADESHRGGSWYHVKTGNQCSSSLTAAGKARSAAHSWLLTNSK